MNKIEKILKLAEKTGDKIIMTNFDGSESFVIMLFDDYKKIVEGQKDVRDLSESELWSQINRNINLWKESNKSDEIFSYGNDLEQNELQRFDPCNEQDLFISNEQKNDFLDNELIEPTFFDEEISDNFKNDYASNEEQKNELEQNLTWQENNLVEHKENKTEDVIIKNDFNDSIDILDNSKENLENNSNNFKGLEKKSRFAIPQERLVHTDKILIDSDNSDDKSAVFYEDIQDDSEVNVEDLMDFEKI